MEDRNFEKIIIFSGGHFSPSLFVFWGGIGEAGEVGLIGRIGRIRGKRMIRGK